MFKTVGNTTKSGVSSEKDGPVTENTKTVERVVTQKVTVPDKKQIFTLIYLKGQKYLIASTCYLDEIPFPEGLMMPQTIEELIDVLLSSGRASDAECEIELKPLNEIELMHANELQDSPTGA